MSNLTSSFTDSQRRHLMALRAAGATSRAAALPLELIDVRPEGANTNVLGILAAKGLSAARRVRRRGRAWTEYYLTEGGKAKLDGLHASAATMGLR